MEESVLVSVGLGKWVNIAELLNKFYPSTRAILHWATDKWLGKEAAKHPQNGASYGLIKILLKSYFDDHSHETNIFKSFVHSEKSIARRVNKFSNHVPSKSMTICQTTGHYL